MKSFKNILTTLVVAVLFASAAFAQGTADSPRVIEVKGTDNMKFDVTTIEAQPGETIKVVLTVVSRIPKQAMGHNIVFLAKRLKLSLQFLQNWVTTSMYALSQVTFMVE